MEAIHSGFLQACADIIDTNSFNAASISLGDCELDQWEIIFSSQGTHRGGMDMAVGDKQPMPTVSNAVMAGEGGFAQQLVDFATWLRIPSGPAVSLARGELWKITRTTSRGFDNDLCITRPDAIEEMHSGFLNARTDIIETNSLNATSFSIADDEFDQW